MSQYMVTQLDQGTKIFNILNYLNKGLKRESLMSQWDAKHKQENLIDYFQQCKSTAVNESQDEVFDCPLHPEQIFNLVSLHLTQEKKKHWQQFFKPY